MFDGPCAVLLKCFRKQARQDSTCRNNPVTPSILYDTSLTLLETKTNSTFTQSSPHIKMALISAATIITSLSLFHITLAFFFLTNPSAIADQTLVFIIGEAMGLVSLAFTLQIPI
jgi:hypothetical protein